MIDIPDTFIACLTPPGRGAIATLALRGPLAWPITRELFQRINKRNNNTMTAAPLPEAAESGKLYLGWLGERSGAADEVVLFVRDSSPMPLLELHCHGGPEVVRLLQDQYQARGVQIVPWPEFQRRHASAWQAVAGEILAQATTLRTAAIALDQWHGAFHKAMVECRRAWESGERETAIQALCRLNELVGVGRHLTTPWRVVLAGAPNVGKSSLSNTLAGFARSIVDAKPGTTRDVVTTTIALDGWPIELADTAGLRPSGDALEQAGISKAQAEMDGADLCLWLVDGAAEPVLPDTPHQSTLTVINKVDLAAAWDWVRLPDAMQVSAKTAAGLAELIQKIVERLAPATPAPGEAVPHTAEQCSVLERIAAALQAGDDPEVTRLLSELG
jgi:tRNA modification GTPase